MMMTERDMRDLKRRQVLIARTPSGGSDPSSSCSGGAADSDTASPQAADRTVQSLPYVKCRESVSAVFGFDRHAGSGGGSARRISTASAATTETAGSLSPERDTYHMPSALSYSVPSTTLVTNTPRGRPAVDVIATYMNTCDSRSVKSDLLRSHAHFSSPHSTSALCACVCMLRRAAVAVLLLQELVD